MRLNSLRPAVGSKRVKIRVGRGIGCGCGKTCGRGHKGQTARSGYSKKLGFEGGQMPFQRRVPKFGFRSYLSLITAEIRLGDLVKVLHDRIGLKELRDASLIGDNVKRVKVILSGSLCRSVTLYGLAVTKGARELIESLGGKVE